MYDGKTIKMKRCALLKDYWQYTAGAKNCDLSGKYPYLAVGRCDTFNAPIPKIFTLIKEGYGGGFTKVCAHGYTNRKKLVNVEYPQELLLSVWSTTVGIRSRSRHPLYLDNANVHLPDFTSEKVIHVVTLSLLSAIIFQMRMSEKYSEGNIGFIGRGAARKLQFRDRTGDCDHSKVVSQILQKYTDLKINRNSDKNVGEVVQYLKNCDIRNDHDDQLKKYSREIVEEIQIRLEEIGYFGDYIPIPESF